MNAKNQFLYSASVPARECWINRERGRSHYKIKTEILPSIAPSFSIASFFCQLFLLSTVNCQLFLLSTVNCQLSTVN